MTPLELTRELVRFDTINPPGRERECADYLGKLLEGRGLEVKAHAFAEGRTSLVASLAGAGEGLPICFTGHIDTVPLGAAPWSREPFAAEVDRGRLYGRGASDMKSGIAAMVVAALRLGPLPRGKAGLLLVLTAGEETGCEGARHLAEQGLLGKAGAVVVGEPTGNHPLIGHKGALWLEAEASGVAAHGSMPEEGVNAIYRAARAIAKLERFDFNLAPHDLMGSATLNVGTISGGLNINSVPDRVVFTVDLRTVPGQSHGELVAALESYLGEEVRIRRLVDVTGVATPFDHPWVREVCEIATPILGEPPAPKGASFFTDASYLTPALGDAPTVILGPGETKMAHQTDEYCMVEKIDQAADAFEAIARRWCGL